VWRHFDRIQVFSSRDAEVIRRVAPELGQRVRINPFGIVLPHASDPSLEDPHSIVFVGGFSHQPNVDAAMWLGGEIMPLLRQYSPGVKLSLVGSYPPTDVQGLACEDIVVTGRVPTVEPYIVRAAVVLAPLRSGGGMRMKVLQAMALGKPVVTTLRGSEGLTFATEQPPVIIAEDAEGIARATAPYYSMSMISTHKSCVLLAKSKLGTDD
jgi:glycosyltransferase involved in cell wall biosynthesis